MCEGPKHKLIVAVLCLLAVAGMVVAVTAHRQIGLWAGSKGVVVAHPGEFWLDLTRLLGPSVSFGSLYLVWRTVRNPARLSLT